MSTRKCLVSVAATVGAILVMPGVASAVTSIDGSGGTVDVVASGIYGQELDISGTGTVTFVGGDLDGMIQNGCSLLSSVANVETVQCTGVSAVAVTLAGSGAGANFIDARTLGEPLTLTGSDGDDTVYGGTEADDLSGGPGEDTLYGFNLGDTLVGGNDGDHLIGGAGEDNATGGPGNDFVGMENDGSGGGDRDTINCGSDAGDIVGVDVNPAGDTVMEQPGNPVGCPRQLPHYRGTATLTAGPVSGSAYSAASIVPAVRNGSAPDVSTADWYLCSGPVVTGGGVFVGTVFQPGGGPAAGCRLAGSGATFAIPSNASGQYLGAVSRQGLATTAGDVPGAIFSSEASSTATARLIAAAPGAPPSAISSFTTPSKKTCKSSKCSLTLTKTAAGKVTIEGSSKSYRKLISKSTSNVKAGKVNVAVKLKSAAKKKLKRKKKLTVSVKVTFQPANAVPLSKKVKITYKLK